jgi:hypothetical protein
MMVKQKKGSSSCEQIKNAKVHHMVKNGRRLSRWKDVNTNIQSYLTMEDNITMCNEPKLGGKHLHVWKVLYYVSSKQNER